MSPREYRLRALVDRLRDERDELRQEVRRLRSRAGSRCIYCGVPTRCSRACPSHRDLLELEWVS